MAKLLERARLSIAAVILILGLNPIAVGQNRERVVQTGRPPWTNDLWMFRSTDGRKFTDAKLFVERGGVVCVARDAKDRLLAVFQWFPFERREAFDRVALMISEDEGETWTKPEPIQVEGLPDGAKRPFDPTLVLLEDGRLRLYFTCSTPARRTPGIYSAISTDGVRYQFEPGLRFGVEDERVADPAVARLGKTWHLFSPVQRVGSSGSPQEQPAEALGYHAVSEDGLTFKRLDDVRVGERGDWIGNVIDRDGELHFYGSGGWLATSRDGANWEVTTRGLRVGGDPGIVKLKDGTYLLIATGPQRRKPPTEGAPPKADESRRFDLRRVL